MTGEESVTAKRTRQKDREQHEKASLKRISREKKIRRNKQEEVAGTMNDRKQRQSGSEERNKKVGQEKEN